MGWKPCVSTATLTPFAMCKYSQCAVRYVQLDGSAGGQIKTGYNLKAVRDLFFACWVINFQWAGSRVCQQLNADAVSMCCMVRSVTDYSMYPAGPVLQHSL